jgi:hypothetical protein
MQGGTAYVRLITLIIISIGAALAADPFTGTWKLDSSRMKTSSPITETVIIEPIGTDGFKITRDSERQGKTMHVAGSFKFDGKEYPFTGLGPTDTMVSVRRIDPRQWEITNKREGVVTGKFSQTVTEDGKTLIMKALPVEGRPAPQISEAVYIKQ